MAKVYYGVDRLVNPDTGRSIDYILYSNNEFVTTVGPCKEYSQEVINLIETPEDAPSYGRVPWLIKGNGAGTGTAMYEPLSRDEQLGLPLNAMYMFAGIKSGFTSQEFKFDMLDFMFCNNASYMFCEQKALDTVYFENVNNINSNTLDLSYMFTDSSTLQDVRFRTSCKNVVNMAFMFYNCTNLSIAEFSNAFNTECYVSTMQGTFMGCESLTSIDLSVGKDFYLPFLKNLSHTFDGCTSLATFTTQLNAKKLESADGMFMNCRALTNLDFRAWNVSSLKTTEMMFYGCTNLKKIYLWPMIPDKLEIAMGMYANCPVLSKIIAPKNTDWDIGTTVIADGMFGNSPSLPNYDYSLTGYSKANNLHEKLGYYIYEYDQCIVFEKISNTWKEVTPFSRDSEGWLTAEVYI